MSTIGGPDEQLAYLNTLVASKHPLAMAVHAVVIEKKPPSQIKHLVKYRTTLDRAVARYKKGFTLQGTQASGRRKMTERYDFTSLRPESRGTHLDAAAFKRLCEQIDSIRLKEAKLKDPLITSLPPLGRVTYKSTLIDLGWIFPAGLKRGLEEAVVVEDNDDHSHAAETTDKVVEAEKEGQEPSPPPLQQKKTRKKRPLACSVTDCLKAVEGQSFSRCTHIGCKIIFCATCLEKGSKTAHENVCDYPLPKAKPKTASL